MAKVHRLAFTLQGNEAAREALAVLLDGRIIPIHDPTPHLRLGIAHDRIAINDVGDARIPQHDEFCFDPLIPVIGLRTRLNAVPLVQVPVVHDLRAGRAHVARGPGLAIPQTTEKLKLDGNRLILFFGHRARVL
jgi:hypothetical protein